jgi:hypothetical protein
LPSGGYILAMTGGTLMHQLNYLNEVVLAVWIESRQTPPQRWVAVDEPVRGALALARRDVTG